MVDYGSYVLGERNRKHFLLKTIRKPSTKGEIVANLYCAQEVLRMTYCELASYEPVIVR